MASIAFKLTGDDKMNIKPLGKRVLVKRKESEAKTESGIFIPDTAKEKTQEGEVIALGTEGDFPIKVGDTILLDKYGGTDFEIGNEKYTIIKTKEILALVG